MTDVFTNLVDGYLDESHHHLREIAARFTKEHITPFAETWEENHIFDVSLYQTAAEAGMLAPHFSEQYGGGGGDVFHGMVVTEELMRGGSTGAVVGLGSLNISIPPLITLGTEEQKQRWLVPILSGQKIAALAITEPGTGSDVAGITTKAIRDGSGYRITGNKTFITSGCRANLLMCLARTSDDPHGGLSFFMVETEREGYTVSRALKKTGWWASDTAEISLNDVYVPEENRIGPEGSGFLALMQNFEGERLMLACNGYCLAEIAFEHALAYSKERQAFGRPIGRFQTIRHKLADMATAVATTKAFTYQCAARMAAGERIPAEVAMAKNHASDVARSVCWDAVQIFGGMGYMRETIVERLARDARLLPIGGGTQEIMKEIIAKQLNF
jgi:acyl-CoA dehydrogenase